MTASQRQQPADDVQRGGSAIDRLGHHREHADEGDDREGHVEGEERRPREPLEEQAGDEEAEDGPAAGDADPHADGTGSLRFGERGGDDRQRRGHDRGRADTHQHADRDELARVGRDEQAQRGGAPEDHQADRQQQPAPVSVAQRAGEEQQAGEHDGVGVHDPGQLGLGGTGVAGDLGSATLRPLTAEMTAIRAQADDDQEESRRPGVSLGRRGVVGRDGHRGLRLRVLFLGWGNDYSPVGEIASAQTRESVTRGRRPAGSGTREAIVEEARRQFGEIGYARHDAAQRGRRRRRRPAPGAALLRLEAGARSRRPCSCRCPRSGAAAGLRGRSGPGRAPGGRPDRSR